MNETTILIIGAGFGQLPAIEVAKKIGFRVVCADMNPNAVGMALADQAHVIDVKDMDGLLDLAKRCGANGVITMQSDLPMPSVGHINDALGFRGVSYATAMCCSNKDQTREALRVKALPQPRFEIVNDLPGCEVACEAIGFPLVVKAPDSSGSRGVTRADATEHVKDAFKEAMEHSRSGVVVVEEFIKGVEVGAQTFSIDGKCVAVCLHDDTVSMGRYMVPTGHSYPLERPGLDLPRIEAQIQGAVEALGIEWGPANVDVIIGEDGNAYAIEIGVRIGATCLPELTTHYLGQDWVELTIRSAVGEDVELFKPANLPCAAEILTSPKDGIFVKAIIPEWIKLHPGLIELEITAKKGEAVSELRKGTDRIGKVFVKAETGTMAVQLAASMVQAIEIVVE